MEGSNLVVNWPRFAPVDVPYCNPNQCLKVEKMNANPVPASNIGIAAINLGFGWAKISLDGVEEKFMSVVSPQHKSVAMISAKSKNLLDLVHFNGESFEVGVEAAVDALSEPMRLISRHWGRSQKYKILAQAILNRMAATGKKNWRILTGLAAEHYQDEQYRREVVEVWRGIGGIQNTPHGSINILSVNIVPEITGGFVSLKANPAVREKMQAVEGAVVDFGALTTNWLPFRHGRPQTDGFRSIDLGAHDAITLATQSVQRRALPNTKTVHVESAFLGLQPLSILVKNTDGSSELQSLDITSEVNEAAAKVWPQIEVALRINLSDPKGMLLLGIGGGVKVFGELFKKSLSESVCIFPDDAEMQNVRGLYTMAKTYNEASSRS